MSPGRSSCTHPSFTFLNYPSIHRSIPFPSIHPSIHSPSQPLSPSPFTPPTQSLPLPLQSTYLFYLDSSACPVTDVGIVLTPSFPTLDSHYKPVSPAFPLFQGCPFPPTVCWIPRPIPLFGLFVLTTYLSSIECTHVFYLWRGGRVQRRKKKTSQSQACLPAS